MQNWRYAKQEYVAIANALQLEAARRREVPIRFNFVARAKFEVAQPIRCRLRAFLLLKRYVALCCEIVYTKFKLSQAIPS